jgi:hypothetical protein
MTSKKKNEESKQWEEEWKESGTEKSYEDWLEDIFCENNPKRKKSD